MSKLDNHQYTTALWEEHTDLEKKHEKQISRLAETDKPIKGVSSITRYVYLPYDTEDHHGSLDRYFNKNKFAGFLGEKGIAELMKLSTLYSNPDEERRDGILRGRGVYATGI